MTDGAAGAVALALPPATASHAGDLLREALATRGARGGGSAELAQGLCGAEQVAELVSLLAGKLSIGTA